MDYRQETADYRSGQARLLSAVCGLQSVSLITQPSPERLIPGSH